MLHASENNQTDANFENGVLEPQLFKHHLSSLSARISLFHVVAGKRDIAQLVNRQPFECEPAPRQEWVGVKVSRSHSFVHKARSLRSSSPHQAQVLYPVQPIRQALDVDVEASEQDHQHHRDGSQGSGRLDRGGRNGNDEP